MYNQFVGIDPGRTGAIAVIGAKAKLPRVFDMPPEQNRGVDLAGLKAIFSQISVSDTLVAIEWNTGRPGEVPDFAFRFGLQTGQIDALAFAMGFDVKHTASSVWTGKLGLPGKTHHGAVEQRATMWASLYPGFTQIIRGPRGGLLDGRLDALLIAHWLMQINSTPIGRWGKRPPKFYGAMPDAIGS